MPSGMGVNMSKAGDGRRAGSKAAGGDGATEVRGYVHADKTLAARLEVRAMPAVPPPKRAAAASCTNMTVASRPPWSGTATIRHATWRPSL